MISNVVMGEMRKAIDLELHSFINSFLTGYPEEFVSMFEYQLGWSGKKIGDNTQGKRIRPLLVLLACQACGGNWKKALPAAAAVELMHNFSLIHDDIQDYSETRRGRPTIWMKWGNAQAINTGDAMLTIAQLSILRLSKEFGFEVTNKAVEILQSACLLLTKGQYLDIAFEKSNDLSMELYWQMVDGKTSSLIAACLGIGALLGNTSTITRQNMMEFGRLIGEAFQVQDDWLGIWGDDTLIGKSNTSDLISRKKTYPILLGMHKHGPFYDKWVAMKDVTDSDANNLANLLQKEGIEEETKRKFKHLYDQGFDLFDQQKIDPNMADGLRQVIKSLFDRIK